MTTLDPTLSAKASVTVAGTTLHFAFQIPRGESGQQRQPGPPGDLSQAQLDAAIAATARNPQTVAPIAFSPSDPHT